MVKSFFSLLRCSVVKKSLRFKGILFLSPNFISFQSHPEASIQFSVAAEVAPLLKLTGFLGGYCAIFAQ